jgi:Cys-rich protein (TIGR01571 family)
VINTQVATEQRKSTVPVYPSYQVLPIGDFQYDLCSCWERRIRFTLLWWNAYICQFIPIVQLLNRFRWNVCATRTKFSRPVMCFVASIVYTIAVICSILFTGIFSICYEDEDSDSESLKCYIPMSVPKLFMLIGNIVLLIVLILMIRVRSQFRHHYNIEGNCLADCCTMWFCTCCASIQMLRQTHDEEEYSYTCCNCLTGLPDNAPEIV